jgi:hypothetical protein
MRLKPTVLLLVLASAPVLSQTAHWDTITRLTADPASQITGFVGQRSIAVDSEGSLHAVWLDSRTARPQVWYRRYDHTAQTWLPETMLTNQPTFCQRPAIACDAAGNVHVVWHMENWPCYGLWYKRYDATSHRWRPDTLIDSANADRLQLFPTVACPPGGRNVHVVWHGFPDTGIYYQVLHKEWRPDSGWLAREQVTAAPWIHEHVSVAADANDDLALVWRGMDFGGVTNQVFCRRRVSGVWQGVELVSDIPNDLSQYAPSVATGSGAVHVIWYGRAMMDLYYRIYYRCRDAGGWSSIDTISERVQLQQQSPSITCAANHECHAVWCGQTGVPHPVMQLRYASRDTAGYWSTPDYLTDRDSSNVCYPTMVTGSDSDLHVIWYDDSSGNQDVYYLRGATSGSGLSEVRAIDASPLHFHIAPNPAKSGFVNLHLSPRIPDSSVPVLFIFDVTGRLVLHSSLVTRNSSLSLDLRSLPSGIYMVRLTCNGFTALQKLVLQRQHTATHEKAE